MSARFSPSRSAYTISSHSSVVLHDARCRWSHTKTTQDISSHSHTLLFDLCGLFLSSFLLLFISVSGNLEYFKLQCCINYDDIAPGSSWVGTIIINQWAVVKMKQAISYVMAFRSYKKGALEDIFTWEHWNRDMLILLLTAPYALKHGHLWFSDIHLSLCIVFWVYFKDEAAHWQIA